MAPHAGLNALMLLLWANPMTDESDAIVRGWRDFLGRFEWAYALTLTTGSPCSKEAMAKEFGRFIRRLERVGQQGLRWFYAVETTHAGHYHLHALLGDTAQTSPARLRHFWKFGFTKILPVHEPQGAIAYAVKSLGSPEAFWDFSPRLRQRPRRRNGG